MPIKFAGVDTGRSDVITFPPEELGEIVLALNLRQDLGDLTELKQSLAQHGQLQPGVVRKDAQGKPVLIAGYRRLAAIMEINQDFAAWNIKGPMSYLAIFSRATEDEAVLLNLRENLDRRELSPVDLAFAARSLERIGWDHSKIADAMRFKSSSRVDQLLGLLELPAGVRKLVHERVATEALAQQLRGMTEPQIATFAERVATGEKPAVIIREVKDQKRSTGAKVSRTLSELRAGLKDLPGSVPFDLLQWIDGDPTVGTLAQVLGIKG